jgi:histidyl-tRNA synthetase
VEVFGSADPALDAEVIALGMHFYQALGLKDVRVEINSVGDQETRERYRRRLIDYFEPVKESLSKEARERLYKNPLRILDSKDPKTKEIAMEAPSILDDLSEPARQHFEQVKSYLDVLKIPYVINDRLVRGLDYYTHTAFEFMVDVPGAQAGTIGGGGRYNGLVEEFGGPEMPGFGFGIGLERVLLALEEQKVEIPVEDGIDCYLITIGEKAKTAGAKWLKALREAGIAADQDYLGRKMKAQFKAADRSNARFAVILGEDEMEQGRINVKHLDSGEQETIELEQLIPYIKANIRRR